MINFTYNTNIFNSFIALDNVQKVLQIFMKLSSQPNIVSSIIVPNYRWGNRA